VASAIRATAFRHPAARRETGGHDEPFIPYLRVLEAFPRRFPGFEHDLHGVKPDHGEYVLTCVRDAPKPPPDVNVYVMSVLTAVLLDGILLSPGGSDGLPTLGQ
jgi:hypothetical protein